MYSLVSVSYSEVLSLLKNVNVSKACGHDGIGNKVIKMCAEGLYESFTDLINLMFFIRPISTIMETGKCNSLI
jgi:hypothetical protein